VLSHEDTLKLIFRPGISTASEITEVSGRGVGLDIVREVAARFNGEVFVSSEPGVGSTIGILVPTAMALLTALVVSVSGSEILIPLDAVRSTRRLASAEIIAQPEGESVLYEGRAVPFVPLAPLLGKPAVARDRWSVIIAQAGSELLALGADRLEGTLDLTVKPLPPEAGAQPLCAGAALNTQGDPVLVLDLRGVLASQRGDDAHLRISSPPPPRLPILVIDDSLTTRTLEQSVLEVAGYEVDLASSGEEGLSKARARRYGLFIVDVEMPGMSGFEFTSLTRADPVLGQIPVILVTSLSSPEHRRRGVEAGAAAYIVKSEFNQGLFLQRVMELLK
jgi:two-component system chemotaxis sensor kinase CheA